jgi:hypothetical protein
VGVQSRRLGSLTGQGRVRLGMEKKYLSQVQGGKIHTNKLAQTYGH